jgi:hypothetical protein
MFVFKFTDKYTPKMRRYPRKLNGFNVQIVIPRQFLLNGMGWKKYCKITYFAGQIFMVNQNMLVLWDLIPCSIHQEDSLQDLLLPPSHPTLEQTSNRSSSGQDRGQP